MGFSAEKTYDIECWIPSEKKFREFLAVLLAVLFNQDEWELSIKLVMVATLWEH